LMNAHFYILFSRFIFLRRAYKRLGFLHGLLRL